MTIYNLGSINADYFYSVPHIPSAGETLTATELTSGLGGKGANMSVAIARAGSDVVHIGAVGPDGDWAIDRLRDYGVDIGAVDSLATPTGHARICVAADGENSIILFSGANHEIPESSIKKALATASKSDWVLIQNETNNQVTCAKLGSDMGLKVAYAAAPFSARAVMEILPYVDFLILNEIEAEQLKQATDLAPDQIDVADVIVTLGSQGCDWFDNRTRTTHHFPAQKVVPVDTTGAGDTFTGYVLAGLDQGSEMAQAIELATKAAALMVQRQGTADVIPLKSEL